MEEMRVKSPLSGGVKGRYVRKRTPFYFWHGSVCDAALRRTPPSSLFLIRPSLSLPREPWLVAKTAGSLGQSGAMFYGMTIRDAPFLGVLENFQLRVNGTVICELL